MATSSYGPDLGGILNVKMDTRGFRLPAGSVDPVTGRKTGGQFTNAQSEFRDRNRQLAQQIQGRVVQNIQARVIRRAVSTGRLLKATADTRNINYDAFGLHVGIESHLNRSTAKYWRTIEEGSAVVWPDVGGGRPSMIGLELKGFFGSTIIGLTDGGRRALAGPSFTKPSTKVPQTGKFMPSKAKKAGKGEVRKEIAPMYAYRDAYRDLDVETKAIRNVEKFLFDITSAEGFPIISKGFSKYF